MPSYTAPVKDLQFVLHDLLNISEQDVPGYSDLDRDFTSAVLEEAGKVASEVLSPLNVVGDTEGCVLENGVVRTPKGFQEAFDQMREGGWTALDAAEQYGGQGLPYIMHMVVNEPFVSANMAFNMYQGLTHGAYSAILEHGWALCAPKQSRRATGRSRFPARRSLFQPASTTWPTTSFTWCWQKFRAVLKESRVSPCSSFQSSL